jgi:hypothetical protein
VPWKPAVPPPPVTGAAGGTLLLFGEAVTVSVTVVTCGCAFDAADAAPEDTPGVPDADVPPVEAEVPDEAELPEDAEAVPVGKLVTVGEMTVGVVGEDEVHAETATGASSVSAAQHSAVSLAPNGVPAVIPRSFMDPPPAPGR